MARKGKSRLGFIEAEIVQVIDLCPINLGEGEGTIQFRVEILRNRRAGAAQYTARVWRKELFRLNPTFPQRKGKPVHTSDEFIFVEDDFFFAPNKPLAGRTPKAVLALLQRRIQAFMPRGVRPSQLPNERGAIDERDGDEQAWG